MTLAIRLVVSRYDRRAALGGHQGIVGAVDHGQQRPSWRSA